MRLKTAVTLGALAWAACKKEEAATPKPAAEAVAVAAAPVAAAPTPKVVELQVTEDGFVPSQLTVKAGQPVTFRVVRKTDETCATEILIEGTDIKKPLPLNEAVEVAWTPPAQAGKVKFGCAMDMMIGGTLTVE